MMGTTNQTNTMAVAFFGHDIPIKYRVKVLILCLVVTTCLYSPTGGKKVVLKEKGYGAKEKAV